MTAAQEIKFTGSPYDVVRRIVVGDHLPKERAGYILAKYALSKYAERSDFDYYAKLALHRLTDEDTASEHQPPLSDELKTLTRDILDARSGGYVDLASDAVLLLAWAVDEGERGAHA
jgi:hypothetical protein